MRSLRRASIVLVVSALAGGLVPTGAGAAAKPTRLRVMTRNLNLGANLELGVRATSIQGLVDVAATILHQVDANKVLAVSLAG